MTKFSFWENVKFSILKIEKPSPRLDCKSELFQLKETCFD